MLDFPTENECSFVATITSSTDYIHNIFVLQHIQGTFIKKYNYLQKKKHP